MNAGRLRFLDGARGFSITGRILDVDNRPVGHAATLELAQSDDHGEYRLFSLMPGRYYLAARLEDLTRVPFRSVSIPPEECWRRTASSPQSLLNELFRVECYPARMP